MIGLQMEEEEALGKMMLEVVVEVGLLVSLLLELMVDQLVVVVVEGGSMVHLLDLAAQMRKLHYCQVLVLL